MICDMKKEKNIYCSFFAQSMQIASDTLQFLFPLSAAGLFKYVWPLSEHQAFKG